MTGECDWWDRPLTPKQRYGMACGFLGFGIGFIFTFTLLTLAHGLHQ